MRTSFKVKKPKVMVTRPINTEIKSVPYLPTGRPTNFKLGILDGARRPISPTSAMASEVKGQGRKVT